MFTHFIIYILIAVIVIHKVLGESENIHNYELDKIYHDLGAPAGNKITRKIAELDSQSIAFHAICEYLIKSEYKDENNKLIDVRRIPKNIFKPKIDSLKAVVKNKYNQDSKIIDDILDNIPLKYKREEEVDQYILEYIINKIYKKID